jgi:hypothetical protein
MESKMKMEKDYVPMDKNASTALTSSVDELTTPWEDDCDVGTRFIGNLDRLASELALEGVGDIKRHVENVSHALVCEALHVGCSILRSNM